MCDRLPSFYFPPLCSLQINIMLWLLSVLVEEVVVQLPCLSSLSDIS